MSEQPESFFRILQLLPAMPGWQAVYANAYTKDEADPGFETTEIVCWALVQDETGTSVMAMEIHPSHVDNESRSSPTFVYKTPDFLGFSYPGCLSDWKLIAQSRRDSCWIKAEERWEGDPS